MHAKNMILGEPDEYNNDYNNHPVSLCIIKICLGIVNRFACDYQSYCNY